MFSTHPSVSTILVTQMFVLSLLPQSLMLYFLLVFQDFVSFATLSTFPQIFEAFSKTVLHTWNTLLLHPKRLFLFHILPYLFVFNNYKKQSIFNGKLRPQNFVSIYTSTETTGHFKLNHLVSHR